MAYFYAVLGRIPREKFYFITTNGDTLRVKGFRNLSSKNRRWVQIAICAVASFFLTWSFSKLDHIFGEQMEAERALNLSRQVMAQVEGLVYVGKRKSETDSLGFAVDQMNQAGEARVYRVVKWKAVRDESEPKLEAFADHFSFHKSLVIQDGVGAEIIVNRLPYLLFGSRSRFFADFWFLLLWMCFGVTSYFTWYFYLKEDELELKLAMGEWSGKFKEILVQSGGLISNTLKSAFQIVAFTEDSRKGIERARTESVLNVQAQLAAREILSEFKAKQEQIEVHVLNLLLECAKSPDAVGPLFEKIETLQSELTKGRQTYGLLIDRIERGFQQNETLAQNLVQIELKNRELDTHTHALNLQVGESKQAMGAQVELLRNLDNAK